jgi:hypothetical protein
MTSVYVAEVTAYDPALPGERTFYFATDLGFASKPSDTPANTTFEGRITQPALIQRDAFEEITTSGRSRVGHGELVLSNTDAALDAFNDYGLDGRRLIIRVGNEGAAYPAGFLTLFRGTMEQPTFSDSEVRIRIRDETFIATKDYQTNKYLGNNALPNGLEGLEDLKGKPKPRLYGWAFNIEPVLVNSAKLIYQVNDGAIRDVLAVYDGGAYLSHGTAYTSQADMEANQPTPGSFRVWPAGGYFRLGAALFGQLTCDAVEGNSPLDRTAAQIFKRILTGPGGLASGDVSASDLTTLDAQNSATLGLYHTEDTKIQDVLDLVARSVGAWWAPDVNGLLRIKRLDLPSGTPDLTLTADQIKTFDRVATNDADAGLPAYRVTVRAVRNHTIQTSGLAGSVSVDRRARLAQPYQDASATDAAVQTKHLLSPALTFETALSCLTDANTEAARILTLRKTRRDAIRVEAEFDDTAQAAIDLGKTVLLQYNRYGLGAGKLFLILGYQLNPRQNRAYLTLWG